MESNRNQKAIEELYHISIHTQERNVLSEMIMDDDTSHP